MVAERTETTARPGRSADLWLGALVAWTLFVWVGRIRNVLADPGEWDADRWVPLALSLSFLVAVGAVALTWWRRRGAVDRARSEPARSDRAYRVALWVLAGWTTLVWVLRAGDIALTSDCGAAFIAVHVVLAVVSIGLAAGAVLAERRARFALHNGPLSASHPGRS